MALDLTPGSSTILSCSFTISEVFGRSGMIEGSLIRPGLTSLQTKFIGAPTIRLSCDTTQIFHDHTHAQLISPSNQPNHCYSCHLLQVAGIFMLNSGLWYDLVDCTKHTNILLLLLQHRHFTLLQLGNAWQVRGYALGDPICWSKWVTAWLKKHACMLSVWIHERHPVRVAYIVRYKVGSHDCNNWMLYHTSQPSCPDRCSGQQVLEYCTLQCPVSRLSPVHGCECISFAYYSFRYVQLC